MTIYNNLGVLLQGWENANQISHVPGFGEVMLVQDVRVFLEEEFREMLGEWEWAFYLEDPAGCGIIESALNDDL